MAASFATDWMAPTARSSSQVEMYRYGNLAFSRFEKRIAKSDGLIAAMLTRFPLHDAGCRVSAGNGKDTASSTPWSDRKQMRFAMILATARLLGNVKPVVSTG